MRLGYSISVAGNLVLLAALVMLWRSASTVAPGARPVVAAPAPSHLSTAAAVGSPGNAVSPVQIGGDWHHWIEPLRQAGVPTEVLAGLVQADFDRRWQTRQAALQQRYMRGEIDADRLAAAGIERDTELDHELAAALGPEQYRAWDMERVLAGTNVDRLPLSAVERSAVYDLERGLRDELRQLESEKLSGAIDQTTFNRRQQNAQDAVDRQLQVIVGAPRAAQLQGADDTVGTLRRALRDDALTPMQLDTLAALQRTWDGTRSRLLTREINTDDPRIEDQLRTEEAAYRERFDDIAGTGALERFQKAQDSRYIALERNASRWGLAQSLVDPVFATIVNFEDTAKHYARDATERGVDPRTRNTTLLDFQQKTEQALELKLGPSLYGDLRRNGIVPVLTTSLSDDR